MVGSELNIFSNNHWRIYQISVGGLLYIYGDLLESPQYPQKGHRLLDYEDTVYAN